VSRAFWYLARELAKSYALIGVALLVLFDLLAFITESQDIGDAQYNVLDALLVVIYSTPALLVDLSPFIALLGTLNAYDRLNAASELIALRAAGVSGMRLGRVAAMTAVGFVLVIAAVEFVARPLRLEASLLRIHETTPTGNLLRGSGFWVRTGTMYVNVSALQDVRGPTGIRMFGFTDDARLSSYLRATSAEMVNPALWHLENVWRKSYKDDGAPNAPEIYAEFDWKPTWDRTTRLYDLPIASLTIDELRTRVAHHANGSVGAQAEGEMSELWRRLTLPLAVVAYAFLAVPFALLSNIRGGRSARLAIGAALAFLVYIGQQVVLNAGILAGLSISVTSAVLPALVLVFALSLMRRMT
jgi:lipopolysaccharide export system permease protein